MAQDPFAEMKAKQREAWTLFTPLEVFTSQVSPQLVAFAGIRPGQKVLDVGTGTGVAALAAARAGAQVTGVDLTPELLARAKENAGIMGLDSVTWKEGDAENLPVPDAAFDVVISQFGHMFGPRAQVAADEMLRALKPGGTVAFATWPPQFFIGRMFQLVARYLPPPAVKPDPPPAWGDPSVVQQRLGSRVRDLAFDAGILRFPALSPQHARLVYEKTAGPVITLLRTADAATAAQFRRELDGLIGQYFTDNAIRQDFLLARATKV